MEQMKMYLRLLYLCFLASALTLAAREYRVPLEPLPGEDQIFFLDLEAIKADSATFKLTTEDGRDVPFSFDMRIMSPDFKNLKQADGFRTWSTAPASENRFLKPGWLSFKRIPGAKRYVFSFHDGANTTEARPNPAVRAWWIELSNNPDFKDVSMLYFKKEHVSQLPDGGVKTTDLLRFRAKGMNLDPRGAGRRILGCMRVSGSEGKHHFSVQYRNAHNNNAAALNLNFILSNTEQTDVCAEGTVSKQAETAIRNKNFPVYISPAKDGFLNLKSFHVQLPPRDNELKVVIPSSLLNIGDTLVLRAIGLGAENILPFTSDSIKGFRVGSIDGKLIIESRLLDKSGNELLTGMSTIALNGIKAGQYTLEAKLYNDGAILNETRLPVTIQQGPF